MKVLTKEGAAELLTVDALDAFVDRQADQLRLAGTAYTISPDTEAKTTLARFLAYLLLKQPEVCVYLTGWSRRPYSENLDLFYGYRLSTGETRLLCEAPVHVFDHTGSAAMESILCMVLYFGWEACIFDVDGKAMVRIGHDGRLELRTNDQRDIVDFATDPERYLKPMRAKAAA